MKFYPKIALCITAIGFVIMGLTYKGGTSWGDFNVFGQIGMILFFGSLGYCVLMPFAALFRKK